jgi:hypothetical protein
MNSGDAQILFFRHLKSILPPHLSIADEVAGLLNISPDSAYRRIRGEKPISLEELRVLSVHFNVSVDQVLNLHTGTFLFAGNLKPGGGDSFQTWISSVHDQLLYMAGFDSKHMYWLLKDISPFAHFLIPELAMFKFYLWMKSILYLPDMKGIKFETGDKRYEPYLLKSNEIVNTYNRIPTTEIWNIESLNSTLRQIQFHYEAGSFKNKAEALMLFEKVGQLIDHIELQAETGKKFRIGQNPSLAGVDFNMFVNELILGDNSILLETDHMRLTFLNHSVLYFVYTRDETFNDRMFENLQNLMQKSTLISKVSEKERISFFNRLREGIQQRASLLKF